MPRATKSKRIRKDKSNDTEVPDVSSTITPTETPKRRRLESNTAAVASAALAAEPPKNDDVKVPSYWKQHSITTVNSCRRTSFVEERFTSVLFGGQQQRLPPFRKVQLVSAERNENVALWRAYRTECEKLKGTSSIPSLDLPRLRISDDFLVADDPLGVNERYLFHGTSKANAASILENGFDVSRASTRGNLGAGCYFTPQLEKALQYPSAGGNRAIIIARVAVGNPHQLPLGVCGVIAAPAGCQSVIGEPYGHIEVVVYDQHRAFPEFVVWLDIV